MRYPIFHLAIAALLLTMSITPVLAAVDNEPVARVAALRNHVTAINVSGEKRALKVRSDLFRGDTIVTGKKARLQILFTDNTIISLGRQTTFIIKEYLWQPDKQEGEFRSEVKEGIFRVMGGKLTKEAPQNFTTKTPAATIGIRGSMYAGVVSGDSLSVVFQGGRGIIITNQFGTIEIQKPGYGTHVRAHAKPPPPTPFKGDDMEAFTSGFTGSDGDQGGTADGEAADDGSNGNQPQDEPAPEQAVVAPEEAVVIVEPPPLPPPSDTNPLLDIVTSWVPPTDGITRFQGALEGTSIHFDDGSQENINEPMDIYANWHNHKVLGIVYDPLKDIGMPVFFFGDINGSLISSVKVFGTSGGEPLNTTAPLPGQISVVQDIGSGGELLATTDPFPSQISAIEGSGSGNFQGTNTGTFHFQASGYDYAIEPATQPALSSWQVDGVGLEVASGTVLQGSESWQGYVVGISEDMNNIDINRRLLTSGTGEFSLSINKDTGNLSGSISANDDAFSLNNITVGSTYGSAFIHDDLFAAILGGGSVPLKPHGNYLVTGPKDKQFMAYATWGYWEVAYSEGTSQYHNHVPGAMWVAGQPTSATDLAALASNSVVGTYAGQVMASRIDTSATMQVAEVGGSVNMNVTFSGLGSRDAITGNMALDGRSFTVNAMGTADSPNFNGNLGDGTFSGMINGTFYGPSAQSVGGNFQTNSGTVTYQGIYGGNR